MRSWPACLLQCRAEWRPWRDLSPTVPRCSARRWSAAPTEWQPKISGIFAMSPNENSWMFRSLNNTSLRWCDEALQDTTQFQKFETKIPWKGTVRPQSQFPHSCVCEPFIYSNDWSAYSAAWKYVDRSWGKYINRSKPHECGSWDWGHAILFLGIHKWDSRYSVPHDKYLDAVQGRDTSVRDASAKGSIIQGTRRPRDTLSKGRNILDFSFRDTLSRHIKYHWPSLGNDDYLYILNFSSLIVVVLFLCLSPVCFSCAVWFFFFNMPPTLR